MLLLGCYRKGDCADPEVFVTAAIAVFAHYPDDVVRKVSDPHSGLPATSKWFPTIAELRDACEAANAAEKRKAEQDARVAAQFAERDRMAAMDSAERRREFIKSEMAKISATFATTSDKPPPPLDLRGMEDCVEKQALRRRLDRELSTLATSSEATPLKLSPTALATFGLRPKAEIENPSQAGSA